MRFFNSFPLGRIFYTQACGPTSLDPELVTQSFNCKLSLVGTTERLFNLDAGAVTVSKRQGLLAVRRPVRGARAVQGRHCDHRGQRYRCWTAVWGHVRRCKRSGQSPRVANSHTWASGPRLRTQARDGPVSHLARRAITNKTKLRRPSLATFPNRHFSAHAGHVVPQAAMEAYPELGALYKWCVSGVPTAIPGLTDLQGTPRTLHVVILVVMIYCNRRTKHKISKGKDEGGKA